ncbi:helix-turn-helix domain-containing protein [Asticcacaulis sp. W401b]|uniref:helix-turn-helix domain-containing protein n=1 Tax=Asticcacaulis sp. W401b TaxID=3388666 RepID=UPI003970ABF6
MFDAGSTEHTPNPIDVHVGARVRMRRKFLSFSQQQLAEALGLTFQQVQKYERGANRISASKLFETAKALKVPVAYFFEGVVGDGYETDDEVRSSQEEAANAFLLTAEGIELAAAFPRISSLKQRKKILDLVTALAEDDMAADI